MRRLAVCHSSLLPLALLLCAAKADHCTFVTVRDGLPPMAMVSGLDELGEYKLSNFTSRDGASPARRR